MARDAVVVPVSLDDHAVPTSLSLRLRFTTTERVLHWAHALAFFGMFGSGLLLYVPAFSEILSRPHAKAVHLGISVGWLTSLALVWVVGNRRQLRRARQEIERFVDDDVAWLRGRRTPQPRFNAGQKLHTIVQAAFAVLFTVSGVLLFLGERNTAFRFSGTITLHDGAMFVAGALVIGHVFLALIWRPTRPAVRGMVDGTVRADWAARHHGAWVEHFAPPVRLTRRRAAIAAAVVAVGVGVGWWVVTGAAEAADVSASVSWLSPFA